MNYGMMTALQTALGALGGGLQGYGKDVERMKKEEEAKREMQRQIAMDAITKAAAARQETEFGMGMNREGYTLVDGAWKKTGQSVAEQNEAKTKAARALELANNKEAWRALPQFKDQPDSVITSMAQKGPPGAEWYGQTPDQIARDKMEQAKIDAAARNAKIAASGKNQPTQEELDEAEAAWNSPLKGEMAEAFNAMRARGDKRPPQVLMLAAYRALKARGGIPESLGGVKAPAQNPLAQALSGNSFGGANPAAAGVPGAQASAPPPVPSAPPTIAKPAAINAIDRTVEASVTQQAKDKIAEINNAPELSPEQKSQMIAAVNQRLTQRLATLRSGSR